MKKLRMSTKNKADENFEILASLFPDAVTESIDENGEAVRAIDADVLRQEISGKVVEGKEERYQFTWPDKKKSIIQANASTNRTLRLKRESSVGKDGCIGSIDSQNIYIEGDNLDALKILRESYLGKIKLIYIDPPYNTGGDLFVYDDDSSIDEIEFSALSGQLDEEGNKLFDLRPNNESNGRYHTNWLNMMYSRLRIAKDLLKDDGFIYISIDDNEIGNLLKICDEVFGKQCFVGNICRATGTTTAQGTESLGKAFDYLVVYSKSPNYSIGGLELSEKDKARYTMEDERGKFSILQLRRTGGEDRREDRPSMYYGIETPDGKVVFPKGPTGYDSRWRVGQDTYKKMLANNEIYFKKDGDGYGVYYKFYLEGRTKRPSNLWNDIEGNKKAQIDLKALIPEKVFETPKPIEMIKRIISIANVNDGDIVMDFFSGSGTTAQAVMQFNAEQGIDSSFILVQIPENTEEGSEAYKAGYKTICQIGEERVKRAGAKIIAEGINDVDCGFRVFSIDESNMKDVYYIPGDTQQTMLDALSENIREDRSQEDLLIQVMLDLGIFVSSKIIEERVNEKKIFIVADGFLIACFDSDITEEVVENIARKKPYYAVFRDDSIANDCVATNFDQIFETYSPETERRVL